MRRLREDETDRRVGFFGDEEDAAPSADRQVVEVGDTSKSPSEPGEVNEATIAYGLFQSPAPFEQIVAVAFCPVPPIGRPKHTLAYSDEGGLYVVDRLRIRRFKAIPIGTEFQGSALGRRMALAGLVEQLF